MSAIQKLKEKLQKKKEEEQKLLQEQQKQEPQVKQQEPQKIITTIDKKDGPNQLINTLTQLVKTGQQAQEEEQPIKKLTVQQPVNKQIGNINQHLSQTITKPTIIKSNEEQQKRKDESIKLVESSKKIELKISDDKEKQPEVVKKKLEFSRTNEPKQCLKIEQKEDDKKKQERERLERENSNKLKLEKEQAEKDRVETERISKEKLQKEIAEKERQERDKQERQRQAKLEQQRQERQEHQRQEQQRLEKERQDLQRQELDRQEKQKQEKEKQEYQRQEQEKLEKLRQEKERLEKERQEKLNREQQENNEREKLERDRAEIQKQQKGKIEQDRINKEKIEQEKITNLTLKTENIEKERKRNEQAKQQQVEKDQEKLIQEQDNRRQQQQIPLKLDKQNAEIKAVNDLKQQPFSLQIAKEESNLDIEIEEGEVLPPQTSKEKISLVTSDNNSHYLQSKNLHSKRKQGERYCRINIQELRTKINKYRVKDEKKKDKQFKLQKKLVFQFLKSIQNYEESLQITNTGERFFQVCNYFDKLI